MVLSTSSNTCRSYPNGQSVKLTRSFILPDKLPPEALLLAQRGAKNKATRQWRVTVS
jgi:hypothetical protein